MGFTINTNLDALNTYRNLTNVQSSLSSSLAKLSSGLRINNAGDDAAGLTISTALGSQVSGLQQASRNAQDGVSVVQTADGALSQAQNLLGRLRDLAVQAANDSNSSSARSAIKTEATSISDELKRLGNSVNFNGKNLLDGNAGTLKFQVGANGDTGSQISVNLNSANLVSVSTSLSTGAYSSGTSYTGMAANDANGKTLTFASTVGGATTTVAVAVGGSAVSGANDYAGLAKALNTDSSFASKYTAVVSLDTNGYANGVTIAANDGSQVKMDATSKGYFTTSTMTEATGTATTGIQFDTADHAQLAITAIDAQLSAISTARANIGALENRFASAVSTISTSITNLTAAKSRITDVDMAQEMVNYSRSNVLSQAGTAMLAQANAGAQSVLKLLQ